MEVCYTIRREEKFGVFVDSKVKQLFWWLLCFVDTESSLNLTAQGFAP